MVRNRNQKERKIGKTSAADMKEAVRLVMAEGRSIRDVSKSNDVKFSSLRRYVEKSRNSKDPNTITFAPNYSCRQVFSHAEEIMLKNYLVTASKIQHGLSRNQVRKLAYEFATQNNKVFPESWKENECAGEDWFSSYMKRFPDLSLRRPEATSLSRATSFNKKNVMEFFNNLENIQGKYNFSPNDIYNADETGCTTVQKVGNTKVIASKNDKQVGKITSGERGTLVTLLAAVNAAGNSVPLFMVFPRVHLKNSMLHGAPPGTVGVAHQTGWMTSENFYVFIKHFIASTKCTKERPVLLILHNHETHLSIKTIDLAKDNGIVMLTLPPHCSHKLQPLDQSVYGPFKSYFNQAANAFMVNHPGQPITIHDIAGVVGNAYPLAFTPRNILAGFRRSGICPFNPGVFSEEDFLCSFVTDRPLMEPTKTVASSIPPVALTSTVTSSIPSDASSSTVISSIPPVATTSTIISSIPSDCFLLNCDLIHPTCCYNLNSHLIHLIRCFNLYSHLIHPISGYNFNSHCIISPDASTSTATSSIRPVATISTVTSSIPPVASTSTITPEQISPFPKAPPRKNKGHRQKGKTVILTDTPVKEKIRQAEEEKMAKKSKKPKRSKSTSVEKPVKKLKFSVENDSSCNESDEDIMFDDSSEHSEVDDTDHYDSELVLPEARSLQPNDFVVVKFSAKKTTLMYVGQIIKVVEDSVSNEISFEVKFLRREKLKPTSFSFVFPNVEDVSIINFEDLVGKLPRPLIHGGIARVSRHLVFPVDFASYANELR